MAIQLSGSLAITGSLVATSQIIAQTLNVQQVTSSIVYSSGSNIFGNSVSNTQQFTGSLQVSSSTSYILGNVGVGTTSPTVRLQVSGTIAVGDDTNGWGRLSFDNTTNTTRLQSSKNGTDSVGLSFWTQASGGGFAERMIISGSNVGIGTTTPSYRLVVNSGAEGISTGISGATYGIRFDNGGTFSSEMSTIHGVDSTLTGTYQPIMINGSDVRFGTSATERMRLTSTGLGIGTTSPSYKLEVAGSARFNTSQPDIQLNITDSTQYARLYFLETESGLSGVQQIGSTFSTTSRRNRLEIFNSSISFINGNFTDPTMLITGSNVGIGTTSPSYKLDVTGTARTTDNTVLASSGNYVSIGGAPFYAGTSVGSLSIRGDLYPGIAFYTGSAGGDLVGQIFSYGGTGNIILNADPNNSNSSTTIQFHVDDSFKMLINASGNVGIGTTSPIAKLDVRISDATAYTTGSAGNTLTLYNTSTTTNAFVGIDFLGEPTSGNAGRAGINMITVGSGASDLAFSTRGSSVLAERMRITSGGRVGVGTTDIDAKFKIFSNDEANLMLSTTSKSSVNLVAQTQAIGLADLDIEANNIKLYTGTIERMRITSGGNVGIGTTSPESYGKFAIRGGITAGGLSGVSFSTSDAVSATLYINHSIFSGVGSCNLLSDSILVLGSSSVERIRITTGGNVGIGTTAPQTFLHVLGSNTSARGQLSIQSNNTSNAAKATWYYDTFNSGEIGTTGSDFYGLATNNFLFYAGGAERMRITSGGSVGIGTTSLLNTNNFQMSAGSGASATPYMAIFNTAATPTVNASTRFDLGFLNGSSDYVATDTILGYINFMGQANDAGYGGAGIYAKVVSGGNVGRGSGHGVDLIFNTKATDTLGYNERIRITSGGTVQPGANGTQDLGTSSLRWATVFTSDLSLSNGIGDYTIVEGENDLFLYNNKQNKVYKFVIEEVDPSIATPKKS